MSASDILISSGTSRATFETLLWIWEKKNNDGRGARWIIQRIFFFETSKHYIQSEKSPLSLRYGILDSFGFERKESCRRHKIKSRIAPFWIELGRMKILRIFVLTAIPIWNLFPIHFTGNRIFIRGWNCFGYRVCEKKVILFNS